MNENIWDSYVKSNEQEPEAGCLLKYFSFSNFEKHTLTHCKDQKWEESMGKSP